MVGNSLRGKVALNLKLTDAQVAVRTAVTIWGLTPLRIGIPARCRPIVRGKQPPGLLVRISPAWWASQASGTDTVTPARCLRLRAACRIDCQPDRTRLMGPGWIGRRDARPVLLICPRGSRPT